MGWWRPRSVDRSKRANGALLSPVEVPRPFYAVILPTFNERNNLPFMIALIHEAFDHVGLENRYQVIVVDDNSPDGTLQVAATLQRLYGDKRLVLAPRSGKLGLGTAYRHGMAHVSSECTHVFLMDADLSHNPSAIPSFIRCMETTQADIVTGTRYIGAGGVCGWDLKRKITSSAANLLTQWMVAPGLSDVTGSYRLYQRQVLEQLLDAVQPRGYVFQMEVMVRAVHQFHYRVAEVPIVFVDRMWYGESKLGIREIVEYLGALWRLAWLL